MAKNFAVEDEKIPENEDYITDGQWYNYIPTYLKLTGMSDENAVMTGSEEAIHKNKDKLWRNIKVIKIDLCVAKNTKKNKWSKTFENRYKNLLDARAKKWSRIEAKYVIRFITKFIDNIPFYHDS